MRASSNASPHLQTLNLTASQIAAKNSNQYQTQKRNFDLIKSNTSAISMERSLSRELMAAPHNQSNEKDNMLQKLKYQAKDQLISNHRATK